MSLSLKKAYANGKIGSPLKGWRKIQIAKCILREMPVSVIFDSWGYAIDFDWIELAE